MFGISMENLPILPSKNTSSVKERRCEEAQVGSVEKFCTKGKFKSSNGTNFIWRNIQLVSKKKEDDFAGLFITECEKKRLEEILNDDAKERCKRNSNQNHLNLSDNAYKLSKKNELTIREINMKLKPISPAPEDMIKKVIRNCQNPSTHTDCVTEVLKSNQGISMKKSTSKLHLTCEDQGDISNKTHIHKDVLQTLLNDTKTSLPLFQYRF